MKEDIMIARKMLDERQFDLIIVKEGSILYQGRGSGLAVLLRAIETLKGQLSGASAADKIVGKAAALLLVYAGVEGIYGKILSEEAERFLEGKCSILMYQRKVPVILNKSGTDSCPMEKMSLSISTPEEAYEKFSHLPR